MVDSTPAGDGKVEDGGFDAVGAGPAIDDPRTAFTEGIAYVGGLGRADIAEGIGARRGQRTTCETEYLSEKRVGGNANGHGILTGGDEIRHDGLATQHDRQRAGPEVGELRETRVCFGDFGQRGLIRHVDDERVEERTSLNREDLGERRGVGRIGREAIDRLGRQGHAGAGTQELGRASEVSGSGGQETGGGR